MKNRDFCTIKVKLVPELSLAVVEMLQEKGLSLKQAAKLVGLDKNILASFLSGQESLPLSALKPFNKLGIPLYQFFVSMIHEDFE